MSKFKYVAMTSAILISAWGATSASWAGPNDFFGSGPYLPGAVGSIDPAGDTPSGSLVGGSSAGSSGAQSAPASPAANLGSNGLPGAGPDNTGDEKRMQNKYKAMIKHCKGLISKGQTMMDKAPSKDSAEYKKGKIFKETGEKHLAELQTTSPFQIDQSLVDDANKRTKKKNDKS